jgi:predicted regulator of Ras-like GTPase activity (Roadblock/LC7/MglB family)
LHDGTEDGERVFDVVNKDDILMIELKTSKKELVLVPWDDIVLQVNAAINSNVVR